MKYWIIAAVAIVLTACSKDISDKLEGKWQIQEIETNGEVQHVDTFYYNFQNSLFMYQIFREEFDSFKQSYGFKLMDGEDQLLLELTHDPRPVYEFLPFTDWQTGKRTFTIESVTHKTLILESEGKRYTFRKF